MPLCTCNTILTALIRDAIVYLQYHTDCINQGCHFEVCLFIVRRTMAEEGNKLVFKIGPVSLHHTCMYMTHIYMYTYIHVYIYTYMYLHVHVHVHVHVSCRWISCVGVNILHHTHHIIPQMLKDLYTYLEKVSTCNHNMYKMILPTVQDPVQRLVYTD